MQIDVPIRKGGIAGEVAAAPMAAHTYWSMVRALGLQKWPPPTNRVVAFADDGGREGGRGMAKSKAIPWTVRPSDGRMLFPCIDALSLSLHSLSTRVTLLAISRRAAHFFAGDTHVG